MPTGADNRNTYRDPAAFGRVLADMQRRIERLELVDGLTRTHPITGADTVATVIETPTGDPVFIASQNFGLELPGSRGIAAYNYPVIDNTAVPVGGDWKELVAVGFHGVVADGFVSDVGVQYSGADATNQIELRMQFSTFDPVFGTSTAVTTSSTFGPFKGPAASLTVRGVWRELHGLTFDASQFWLASLQMRVSAGPNIPGTSIAVAGIQFATQKGSNLLANTSGFSTHTVI